MLRKHQAELLQIARDIRLAGKENFERRMILAHVTPGGGKSALPLILGKEIAQPFGYHICWVVPREALRSQGEQECADNFLRNMIGFDFKLRAAGNEVRPAREELGYITTYQAIAAHPKLHQEEFRLRNYILILDENHHVPFGDSGVDGEEAKWYDAIYPLVDAAKITLLATGTLDRHDGNQVAFVPYRRFTNSISPDTDGPRDGWSFIKYTRTDALTEKAIVPLHFDVMDGKAKWIDPKTGEVQFANSIAASEKKIQSAVLRTILETGYAETLIDRCVSHWRAHKATQYKNAKLLVVAPNINVATGYYKYIQSIGLSARIATSKESDAHDNIKTFRKSPSIDALVTVGMAYEGLDVKEITHVAVLTNIRSRPWIEQCICRANRTDPKNGKTHGYIFVPDDPMMTDITNKIQKEQAAVVVTWPQTDKKVERTNGDSADYLPPVPLESEYTRARGHGLEDGTLTNYDETSIIQLAMEQTGMRGISVVQAKQMMALVGAGVVPNGAVTPDYSDADVLVPSEAEDKLKKSIDNVVKRYARGDSTQIIEINKIIKRRFGPRREAPTSKLQMILHYVNEFYGEG